MTFRLRRERDRGRIKELIQLSGSTLAWFYASFAVLLVGGVGAGVQGHWFNQLWIWLSLALLVATSGAMSALARPYHRRISEAVEMRPSGVPRTSEEELAAILSSPMPLVVAWIGFATLAVIVWLMIFKPA